MSDLDTALWKRIIHIVKTEGRSFSYLDFVPAFKVDEREFRLSQHTFRNKVSYLLQRGEIEPFCYSPQGFYTLRGFKVPLNKEEPDSLLPVKKIFNELIPSKKFLDVEIHENGVRFNIDTPQGIIDIDELSSGEKELLFVFTELIRVKPNNSIILFDEPDLHLNEDVQRRIPDVLESLGHNNQIWISTHSLGIINNAEFDELFRVQHYTGKNQAIEIFDDNSKIELFRDIAGSIGIVTFGEKIVFLEGIDTTDKSILERWFPELKTRIVFVSSHSVGEVNKISQKILSLVQASSKYTYYYAIRDRDYMSKEDKDSIENNGKGKIFVWSKYHIENFLLDEESIFSVLRKSLHANCPLRDSKHCLDEIRQIAANNKTHWVNSMLKERLRELIITEDLGKIRNESADDILKKTNNFKKAIEKNFEDSNVQKIINECESYFNSIITDGS
jgi:hypothetical protein